MPMHSLQIDLAIGLVLGALLLGALAGFAISRRFFGMQVRDLRKRLSRSESARRQATELLDQAHMRLEAMQQRLARRSDEDSRHTTSTAWIEVPEVRIIDTHAPRPGRKPPAG